MGDLDGDGDLDAVLVRWPNASYAENWLNNGSGVFGDVTVLNVPTGGGVAVDTADLDEDGDVDFIVSNGNSARTYVWLNQGFDQGGDEGTFNAVPDKSFLFGGRSIALGDMDGDGDPDAVITRNTSGVNESQVWLNDDTGDFSYQSTFFRGSEVALADMDVDGDLDVVTARSNNQLRLHFNDGTGAVSEPPDLVFGSLQYGHLALGDVDGDGDVDVVGAAYVGLSKAFTVYLNQLDPSVSTDSDGDGVPNDVDVCEGYDDNVDTDDDGTPDGCDVCPVDVNNDSDGDGSCDSVDLCTGDDATGDVDDDGLCNGLDPCVGASNSDADGDGVCDEGDLCVGDDATGNSDGDGVCNNLDHCTGDDASGDTDGDGTCDDIDACPDEAANDADGDGVCESDDNCDFDANPNQTDTDNDGPGDACDDDIDGDTVTNGDDNCPFDANDQADFDGDGAGDVCDSDDDNDGVLDAVDACLVVLGNTPDTSVVDATGCSIADLCPCDNNWKNHGAYVRCVAHTSEDFLEAGLITEAEKDAIVSAAGQSTCGHKNK